MEKKFRIDEIVKMTKSEKAVMAGSLTLAREAIENSTLFRFNISDGEQTIRFDLTGDTDWESVDRELKAAGWEIRRSWETRIYKRES